jgi:hypothetical protein
MKHVLVIDEGHAGHLTQSRGLATALASQVGADSRIFSVELTLRGLLRPLLQQATDHARHGLPDWALRLAYKWSGDLGALHADVIVTSGGNGLYFATSLARRLGCPLVFCGDPSPLPARWCDVVLSPVPIPGHTRVIETELLVTEMSPQRIENRGGAYRDACVRMGGNQLAALLVGGDSRSHHYAESDWKALADGINRLGSRGWRWLISTSPRTPPAAEALLRSLVNTRYLVKPVWWHDCPERVILDFLGAAEIVAVTQDSLSMLSEAMAAGKPVLSLVPVDVRHSAFLESVLQAQQSRRRMIRVPIARLGDQEVGADQFVTVKSDLAAEYASRAAQLLTSLRPLKNTA